MKKMNKKIYIIIVIVALIFLIIIYFVFPCFLQIIDKSIVKNYDFKNEDFIDVYKPSNDELATYIALQNGRNIQCNKFQFYSRGISHHNWDSFFIFKGYYYVNVEGELFYNKTGPCTSADSLRFPGLKIEMITKDIFINALLKRGYKKEE